MRDNLTAIDRDTFSTIAKVAVVSSIVIMYDQFTQVVVTAGDFPFGGMEWRFQAAALLLAKLPAVAASAALTALVGRLAGKPAVEAFGRNVAVATVPIFILSVLSTWFDGAGVKETVPIESLTPFVRHWIRLLVLALAGLAAIIWIWRRLRPRGVDRRPPATA